MTPLRTSRLEPFDYCFPLSTEEHRAAIALVEHGSTDERDLSWLDNPYGPRLSRDGSEILFTDQSGHGGHDYAVYVRKSDGSPAVRIGGGGLLQAPVLTDFRRWWTPATWASWSLGWNCSSSAAWTCPISFLPTRRRGREDRASAFLEERVRVRRPNFLKTIVVLLS